MQQVKKERTPPRWVDCCFPGDFSPCGGHMEWIFGRVLRSELYGTSQFVDLHMIDMPGAPLVISRAHALQNVMRFPVRPVASGASK